MKSEEVLQEGTFSRQDTTGRWHTVASEPCEQCGCLFDYSLDEPGVIWEAGSAIGDGCVDEMCECHLLPVEGLPFKLHFRSFA